mgnify:CR=1 FL=1
MKLLFVALVVAVVSSLAGATGLKTYDCRAAGRGLKTPDHITVQANSDYVVASFPGRDASSYSQPSFHRVSASQLPAGLNMHGGGRFFEKMNGNSFFMKDDIYNYEVMYAFATNGLLRHDAAGSVVFYFKATEHAMPSTNLNEWSRWYACAAR